MRKTLLAEILVAKSQTLAYNKSMTTGTNHFTNYASAVSYYSNMGFKPSDVSEKIASGEISIGPPKTNLKLFTKEGRYFIA